MKFFVVFILAALAGALVCGQETPSDPVAEEPVDNAANPEAPAEITSEPKTAPAEASSDTAQTTLAAEESAENQMATTQKAEPSITRLTLIKPFATYMKNKIEEAEERIKTKVSAAVKKIPRKYVLFS